MPFTRQPAFAGLAVWIVCAASGPVQLTSHEDHRRTLALLHLTEIRRGADARNADAPNAANYDESKANPYPDLPDPLKLKNGKKVTKPSVRPDAQGYSKSKLGSDK